MTRRLLVLILLLPLALPAQNGAFQERLRKQQERFNSRQAATVQSFADRQAALEENWSEHLAAIDQYWNDGRTASREERVRYAQDYKSRVYQRMDDAADASLRADLLIPVNSSQPGLEAERAFEELVADSESDWLEDLDAGDGNRMDRDAGRERAVKQIQTQQPEQHQDAEGESYLHYQVEIPLVPDHIQKRAGRWKEDVRRSARQWDLPPDLVFAVIHTESWFNPEARSHVPAFGMMQLVPRYGGAEAHQLVTGRAGEPEPALLYNGQRNIEYGCAYLHKLRHVYYKDVRDQVKAEMLIICAYNTGPGNVNRALTSAGGARRLTDGKNKGFKRPQDASSSFDRALPLVEQLDRAALREKLLEDLPWAETVDYLQKVDERRANYLAWSRD